MHGPGIIEFSTLHVNSATTEKKNNKNKNNEKALYKIDVKGDSTK